MDSMSTASGFSYFLPSDSLCALTLQTYLDTSGTETEDSCWRRISNVAHDFNSSLLACASLGSQLLTTRHPSKLSTVTVGSLYATILSKHSTLRFWVGAMTTACSGNWTWIDATPATNLNCGGVGCGLWATDRPNCLDKKELHVEYFNILGALNDFAWTVSLTDTICEMPDPVQAGWFYNVRSSVKVSLGVSVEAFSKAGV